MEDTLQIELLLKCKKNHQKLMVNALLECCDLDFDSLASCLSISTVEIIDVFEGKKSLSFEKYTSLLQLFFMNFVSCIDFFKINKIHI